MSKRKRITELGREIQQSVCNFHGQTLAQIVERFEGRADKTTVRRNVYKLSVLGYLSLRNEAAVYPAEKGKELLTRAYSAPKEV